MSKYIAVLALTGLAVPALAAPALASPGPALTVMPSLSALTAHYYAAHRDEFARFVAGLPKRADDDAVPTRLRADAAAGGTWTKVAAAPKGVCAPMLLTDGTVVAAHCNSKFWYKLTPDAKGNYATGKWSAIASLPVIGGKQYAPQYHASAVLPDGRMIIEGGEYNGSNTEVWTNLGAIYDPAANAWSAVAPPSGAGWKQIGDAASLTLANGAYLLSSCCANPAADATLNATTLTWSAAAAPNAGQNYQDEQGYELLPSGNVLTLDIWTNQPTGAATNAEQFNPTTGAWSSAGNTPVSLPDPPKCGNWEIGPAVLRGDGTVVAFGGNTGCVAGATADPVAIYDSNANSWSAGPYVPSVCGTGAKSCDLADAPAALLPDGNILFAASSGFGVAPTHFFEFTAANTIVQVSDPLLNAHSTSAYEYDLLVLPNGQILMTDLSTTAEVYTPSGPAVGTSAPTIATVPTALTHGQTYQLSGTQLSGLSQGAYYGDDAQMATNFPIVKITNTATGRVAYAKTTGFTPSVAPNAASTTSFTLPATIAAGASTLTVIANGIAATPVGVTVN